MVTGPCGADWESTQIRPVLEKYFRGAWPSDQRLALLNLVGDLTTRLYGGYQAVLAVHAEGSIEAEKLAMLRAYDPTRAVKYAMRLAGIDMPAGAEREKTERSPMQSSTNNQRSGK